MYCSLLELDCCHNLFQPNGNEADFDENATNRNTKSGNILGSVTRSLTRNHTSCLLFSRFFFPTLSSSIWCCPEKPMVGLFSQRSVSAIATNETKRLLSPVHHWEKQLWSVLQLNYKFTESRAAALRSLRFMQVQDCTGAGLCSVLSAR